MVLTEPGSCPPLAAGELAAGVTVAGIAARPTRWTATSTTSRPCSRSRSARCRTAPASSPPTCAGRSDDPRIALALIRVDGEPAAVAKATSFDGFTYLSSIGTRRALPRPRPRRARHAPRRRDRRRRRRPTSSYLGVFSGNAPALRLYERLGFASVGESPGPAARVRMLGPPHLAGRRPGRLAADLARRLGVGAVAARLAGAGLRDPRQRDPRGRAVAARVAVRRPAAAAAAWCSRRVPGGLRRSRRRPSCRRFVLIGVGWATVELDRAEAELAEWLAGGAGGPGRRRRRPASSAPGRGCRVADGLPGEQIVLLEPTTEGRLAASLVRDGEGPCALYLRPAGGLDGWLERARERGVADEHRAARSVRPIGPASPAAPFAGPHLAGRRRRAGRGPRRRVPSGHERRRPASRSVPPPPTTPSGSPRSSPTRAIRPGPSDLAARIERFSTPDAAGHRGRGGRARSSGSSPSTSRPALRDRRAVHPGRRRSSSTRWSRERGVAHRAARRGRARRPRDEGVRSSRSPPATTGPRPASCSSRSATTRGSRPTCASGRSRRRAARRPMTRRVAPTASTRSPMTFPRLRAPRRGRRPARPPLGAAAGLVGRRPATAFRELPVGPSRHLVRFLVVDGIVYALKELPARGRRARVRRCCATSRTPGCRRSAPSASRPGPTAATRSSSPSTCATRSSTGAC